MAQYRTISAPSKGLKMNDLVLANRAADWRRLKALDSVSSPITRRVYNLALDEFIGWFGLEPRPGFTKATVNAWRASLEARGPGSVSINVRIRAVRKLAVEAADNGLLAAELAAGITRVKGAKSKGVRMGNWLSLRQAQALFNAPDTTTKKGLRDRAILAILLGCGLRQSEVAALTPAHIQQRDNRWCIIDLVGTTGIVFQLTPPSGGSGAWTETVLTSGPTPASPLAIDPSGNLYGTTDSGGANNCGIVFKVAPPSGGRAWTETVLHNWPCANGGGTNESQVVYHDGLLYGTTTFLGSRERESRLGVHPGSVTNTHPARSDFGALRVTKRSLCPC
jgi:uncharacterized repeat protein (TIGR03803 family)